MSENGQSMFGIGHFFIFVATIYRKAGLPL